MPSSGWITDLFSKAFSKSNTGSNTSYSTLINDLNTGRCHYGNVAFVIRSLLIKSLGENALPCSKDAAHTDILDLL